MVNHPLLRLVPHADRRLRAGYPWEFSNEIAMTPAAGCVPGGALAHSSFKRTHLLDECVKPYRCRVISCVEKRQFQ
jgi:hypothetical protein